MTIQRFTESDSTRIWEHLNRLATDTEAMVPVDNQLTIGGVKYQASGSVAVTVPSWGASQAPAYSATIVLATPYAAPPGWRFVVVGCTSGSSYAVAANGQQAGNGQWQIRITQFHAVTTVPVTVHWVLMKDS